jgi:hypothetical protein
MKIIQVLVLVCISVQGFAQNSNADQEILKLSKDKWQWMADKNVDKLKDLFNDKSVFVHMGGSWGKEQELNVIESGDIHYKKADVHEIIRKPMFMRHLCKSLATQLSY